MNMNKYIISIGVVIFSIPCFACKCMQSAGIDMATYLKSSNVFIGKIDSFQIRDLYFVHYYISIHKQYKYDTIKTSVVLYTDLRNGCGAVRLNKSKKYLFYTYKNQESINQCDRIRLIPPFDSVSDFKIQTVKTSKMRTMQLYKIYYDKVITNELYNLNKLCDTSKGNIRLKDIYGVTLFEAYKCKNSTLKSIKVYYPEEFRNYKYVKRLNYKQKSMSLEEKNKKLCLTLHTRP